jgi:hypothetical protein
MDDFLVVLRILRPLWLPSLMLSLAAGAGLALIAWVMETTLGFRSRRTR